MLQKRIPSGTTTGVPEGGTVIMVMVIDVEVASELCWLVFTAPNPAYSIIIPSSK